MFKIAFITPIFSEKAFGGAERHALEFAKLLSSDFEVHIITTTALDYRTWKNEFKAGSVEEKKLKIHRFLVRKKRSIFFSYINKSAIEKQNLLSDKDFENWLIAQGPYVPDLIEFVKSNLAFYDIFFCFTYMYYPVVKSIPYIREKAICLLTLHNEKVAYFPQFKKIYTNEIYYCFNVPEEKNLFEKVFGYSPKNFKIVGMSLSPSTPEHFLNEEPIEFFIKSPYILYLGRIDKGKGVFELIENFLEWKEISESNWELVLVGSGRLEIKSAYVHHLGFVSEVQKEKLIQNSELLVNPSSLESFSIVLMEAWLKAKAVLVNGNSEVLKYHCIRSNGGLFYHDKQGFIACLEFLYRNPKVCAQMGLNGKKYVEKNYNSEIVKKKLLQIINEKIISSNHQSKSVLF